MTEFLKRLSANKITISVIFIILGLLCIILPAQIVKVASLVFGILLFIYALFQLVNILSVFNIKFVGFSIISCALSFILGLVLILNHDAGTLAIGLITGIWALVAGIIHLSQVVILKYIHMPIMDKLIIAIIELLIAVLMFCNTAKMVMAQIIILGVIFCAYGIYTLIVYLYLYKRGKQLHESNQEQIANSNDSNIEIIIEDEK